LGAAGAGTLECLLKAWYASLEIRTLLHLGERQVQVVLQRRRQRWRIVQNDFTSILFFRERVGLVERGRQIARGPESLNEVVGHDHVDRVFRATLRHVAIKTGRAWSGERDLGDAASVRRVVATPAHCDVVLDGLLASRHVVRVMAGHTGHLALLETRRFPKPVRAAGDLELVVVVATA